MGYLAIVDRFYDLSAVTEWCEFKSDETVSNFGCEVLKT